MSNSAKKSTSGNPEASWSRRVEGWRPLDQGFDAPHGFAERNLERQGEMRRLQALSAPKEQFVSQCCPQTRECS